MNRRKFLRQSMVFLAGTLTSVRMLSAGERSGEKPNIILIFADDAGYGDFGFQGSTEIKTPNLDRFAKQGVVCTSAYVTAAVCGPSRAGLLTGKYQQRFGFEENNVPGYMSGSSKLLADEMGLPLSEKTIADYLKPLGYRSMIIGKWHLGNADRYHPLNRGFDEFYGFRGGARDYFPYAEEPQQKENRLERQFGHFEEHQGYITDRFADEACAFIRRNAGRQPFFLYLAFNAVHTPLQAKEEDLALFPNLTGKRKTYAAMMLALDRAVGKVLQQLERPGIAENTIVVFTNDNGGPTDTNGSSNYPLSGTKATHLEGGIRVPFIIRWPGKLKAGVKYDFPISTLDLLPTFVNAAGGKSEKIEGLDGVDLLPFLQGKNPNWPHQTLYWKKYGRAAIRDGDWKLIRLLHRPAQLFNLKEDPSELNDLAAKYPEKTKELFEKLFKWEIQLERPLWMLKLKYEGWSADRYENFKAKLKDK